MANIQTENLDLENGILFCIFKYQEQAIKLTNACLLENEDFANVVNRKLYKELIENYNNTRQLMSFAGFYSYVKSLPDTSEEDKVKYKAAFENIKTSKATLSDVQTYCNSLRKLTCIRKFIKQTKESIQELADNDIEDVIDGFDKKLMDVKKKLSSDIQRNVVEYVAGVDARIKYAQDIIANPQDHGLAGTGFLNIDKWIAPQSNGNLVIYQSRTNVGKSMFLMGTAIENYHRRKLKGIIITIEMNANEYAFRIDSNITKIEHKAFSTGKVSKDPNYIEHWKKQVAKFKQLDAQGDLLIYWVPENCTPAKVDAIITANPFKPDFVIVDYAGDMKAGIKGVPEYSSTAHAEIYSRLKEIAGKHHCVMYTAQQTKRGQKKVTDETGSWSDVASNKADIMIAIEMTEEDKTFEEIINGKKYHGRRTITIIKGRNVPRLRTYVACDFERMSWYEKEFYEDDDRNKRAFKLYDNGYAEYDGDNTNNKPPEESNEVITELPDEISDELLDGI